MARRCPNALKTIQGASKLAILADCLHIILGTRRKRGTPLGKAEWPGGRLWDSPATVGIL
jgi:hypothetical protein